MEKRLPIFALLILPLIPIVYAEDLKSHYDYTPHILAGLTFIVAGVYYSSMGWIKKIRRALTDDTVSLDFKKMGKSVVVGIILGVGAFVYSIFMGEALAINNAHEFLIQVGLNSAAILAIDKIILGTPTKSSASKSSELPPGK